MADKKEDLNKEQLIEKINAERETFARILTEKDEQIQAATQHAQFLSNLVLSRVIRSYGEMQGDEYVLDIPSPQLEEDHFWAVRAEQVDEETFRLFCKQFEIPKME